MALNLTDAYTASLVANTEYVSSSIIIDIMKKLSAMKFPKDIMAMVTGLHVIHHQGTKVYMANDVSEIISRIVIAEMDLDAVAQPQPVVAQIDQSNIASPFVHDEKIAEAVQQTPLPELTPVDTPTEEEPVKRDPLPYIVSIRAEVVPATGLKKTSHAEFNPNMNFDETNRRIVSLVEGLFVGGICNGKFTVSWSNGSNIVQDIDPENVYASIAFVISMKETESRNIAANNA